MTSRRTAAPRWADLRPRWPNHESSRFLDAGGLRWHVQVAGTGPVLLLAHGTGAASFSWGGVFPRLLDRFTVVAPDLPGHGFTEGAGEGDLTLPGMARGLAALLHALDLAPAALVGHSAGAAVLLELARHSAVPPTLIVGLNPALVPPPTAYRWLLAPVVHRVATTGLMARTAAVLAASNGIVDSLLRSTGTRLDPDRRRLYQEFFRSERHAHDVLTMMSGWSLDDLLDALPHLESPVTLIAGREDHWIPLTLLRRVAARMPRASVRVVPGGHLLHEDRPDLAAELVLEAAREAGLP